MNLNKYVIELNDPEILACGINATIDFFTTISTQTIHKDNVIAFATLVNSPYLNFIFDRNHKKEDTDSLILFAKNFFGKLNVPWCWLVPPDIKHSILKNYRFNLLEESPALYFDLSQLIEPINRNFQIEQIKKIEDLDNWIIPIAEQFDATDGGDKFKTLNASLFSNKKLLHFIAYYQNKIASSATLFLSDHSVMLHNLATTNEFQKLGIATELTIHMMTAKSLGYKHCYLDSSEQAFRLYKKLGFQVYGISKIYQLDENHS